MITELPECRCLNCNKKLNKAGSTQSEDSVPSPGNLVLCIGCGAVMMFAEDLTLRGMTREEMDDLCNDDEAMHFLARQVHKIHMLPKLN
jgi:uncharacterized protein with PIN domain